MMEPLKKFFRRGNLLYLLISAALAVLLWLAVTKPVLFTF